MTKMTKTKRQQTMNKNGVKLDNAQPAVCQQWYRVLVAVECHRVQTTD